MKRTGVLAADVVRAAEAGLPFARGGHAVRIFTEQADLTDLPARLSSVRTNVAIIVAAPGSGREAQGRALLQEWGAEIGGELVPEYASEPYRALEGVAFGSKAGTLVVTSSCLPQARAQVERLAEEGALVLTLPREAVLNQDESYLMGVRSGAAAAVKQGRNAVVRSETWPEALVVTRRLADRRGIPVDELESRLLNMLARVGLGVVDAVGAGRLIAVGTETSGALCRVLGVAEMVIAGEAAPGLPCLLTVGDQPILLVLKAGSTGEPDLLVQAAERLAAL